MLNTTLSSEFRNFDFLTMVFLGLALCAVNNPVFAQTLPNQQQCRTLWQQSAQIKPEIEGWCLVLDDSKGHCLSCHAVSDGSTLINAASAGNLGPVLFELSKSYRDRSDLRSVIVEASGKFPDTVMPPYGKHQILSPAEIDLVVKFLLRI